MGSKTSVFNEIYLKQKLLCCLDTCNEKYLVDHTPQIYPKFIKSGSVVNIKVLNGISPPHQH